MCVIIHKPKGVHIDEKFLREGAKANKDGFGVMYYTGKPFEGEKGEPGIRIYKTTKYDINEVCKHLTAMDDAEMVVHFRIATTGSVKNENCHPFNILNKKENASEAWMMHNGTISTTTYKPCEDQTDTEAFVCQYVKEVVKHKPRLLENQAFLNGMSHMIGHSKLVFLHGKGQVDFVNRQLGQERDGMWFSNHSAFPVSSYNRHTDHDEGYYDDLGWNSWNKSYNVRNKRKETSTEIKSSVKPFTLLESEISLFDKVYVCCDKDDNYIEEGKINEFFTHMCLVEFKDETGNLTKKLFNLSTGECVMGDKKYYCYPVSYEKKKVTQSISNFETKSVKDVLNPFNSTQKDLAIKTNLPVVVTGSIPEKKSQAIEDLQKNKEEPSEKKPSVSNVHALTLKYKWFEVNPNDRYGSMGLLGQNVTYEATKEDNSGQEVLDIEEIYNLSNFRRMKFMVDDPRQAFNLLQDLLDFFYEFSNIVYEEIMSETEEDTDDDEEEDTFNDEYYQTKGVTS